MGRIPKRRWLIPAPHVNSNANIVGPEEKVCSPRPNGGGAIRTGRRDFSRSNELVRPHAQTVGIQYVGVGSWFQLSHRLRAPGGFPPPAVGNSPVRLL